MKVVNLGEPYTKRITLRLTQLQYKHICNMAEELDTSPSDYIRYLILESALKYDRDLMMRLDNQEGTSNANVETCCNDYI